MEKEIESKINKVKNKGKFKIAVVVGAIVVVAAVVAFLTVASWQVYQLKKDSGFIINIAKVVPFPAARVNNQFISYYEYLKTFRAAEKFYLKQDMDYLNRDDLREFVLENRLINNALIRQIAKDYNVSVNKDEIDQEIQIIIADQGSQKEFEDFLAEYYDLNLAEYKKIFTEPYLYYQKLDLALMNDENLNGQAKRDIQDILNKIRNGEDFQQFIGDKPNSFLKKEVYRGELPQDIEEELLNMEPGQYTDVVSLPGSFYIIKLDEKDTLAGIFIISAIALDTVGVEDIVAQKKSESNIEIYI